jgi:hypothetical protein
MGLEIYFVEIQSIDKRMKALMFDSLIVGIGFKKIISEESHGSHC